MADQLTLDWSAPADTEVARDLLGLDRGRELVVALADAPQPVMLLDSRGQPRTRANTPGVTRSRPPANKGKKYPPTPPTAAETWALLEACAVDHHDPNHRLAARRTRALIATLWRTGVRISEALALAEHDLDLQAGTMRVRQGKGDKPRTVPIDRWLEPELRDWLDLRQALPAGELFCVIKGPTAGNAIDPSDARRVFRELRLKAGIRKRCAPHQLRHAFAIGLLEEGFTVVEISRMLGHHDLGTTSVYFAGIDTDMVATKIAQDRKPPVMPIPHRST